MKKKILILLISVCCFFLLIFLIVPFLIDNGLQKKHSNEQTQNYQFKEILKQHSQFLKTIEKKKVKEFLNKDNLYENYSHNYTIKIPESYTQNNGIGKYSSSQFYNEDLGYVVAINVANSNFGKSIQQKQNNEIIKKLSNELKNDNSLKKIFEKSLVERGFNNPKLISNEVTNYNNRLFLKLNFNANRVSDNEKFPVLITDFITFHKNLIYYFQFASYQNNSFEKWNTEIQKSMINVMISEYITKKNSTSNQ